MRAFLGVFLALVACTCATPKFPSLEESKDAPPQGRFLDGIVAGILENLSAAMKEAGYDPYVVEADEAHVELPVPQVFSTAASLQGLEVRGASDIVINRMNYAILSSTLTFDISLPSISIEINNAEAGLVLLNHKYEAAINGRFGLKNIGVQGRAQISILGTSLRDLDISLYLGEIRSEMKNVNFLGTDYSTVINRFLNENVYNAIIESSGDINELVNIIAWDIINDLL